MGIIGTGAAVGSRVGLGISGILLKDNGAPNLDRLEIWAGANRLKFSMDMCKVLQLGRSNGKHEYKMGGTWLDGSCIKQDLGGPGRLGAGWDWAGYNRERSCSWLWEGTGLSG